MQSRSSRFVRPRNPAPMQFRDRDLRIIKSVNDYRLISGEQLQRLWFYSVSAANRRLLKLWQHGYLRRQFQLVQGGIQNSKIIYEVDKRGAEILRSELGYTDYELRYTRNAKRSSTFVEHTLGLSDVRVAFELSCKKYNFELLTWLDEKNIKGDHDAIDMGGRKDEPILPDGYFQIELKKGSAHFFVEYDRGTEDLKYFRNKMRAFLTYFKVPAYRNAVKKRYGTELIRVLTVTKGGATMKGTARLKSLKRVTEEVGGKSRYRFAQHLDLLPGEKKIDPDVFFKPIWQTAGQAYSAPLLKD